MYKSAFTVKGMISHSGWEPGKGKETIWTSKATHSGKTPDGSWIQEREEEEPRGTMHKDGASESGSYRIDC